MDLRCLATIAVFADQTCGVRMVGACVLMFGAVPEMFVVAALALVFPFQGTVVFGVGMR